MQADIRKQDSFWHRLGRGLGGIALAVTALLSLGIALLPWTNPGWFPIAISLWGLWHTGIAVHGLIGLWRKSLWHWISAVLLLGEGVVLVTAGSVLGIYAWAGFYRYYFRATPYPLLPEVFFVALYVAGLLFATVATFRSAPLYGVEHRRAWTTLYRRGGWVLVINAVLYGLLLVRVLAGSGSWW